MARNCIFRRQPFDLDFRYEYIESAQNHCFARNDSQLRAARHSPSIDRSELLRKGTQMREGTGVENDGAVALKLTRSRIHTLLKFIAPYKARLILTFVLTLFSAAIGLSYPLLAKFLMDVVLARKNVHLLILSTIGIRLDPGSRFRVQLVDALSFALNFGANSYGHAASSLPSCAVDCPSSSTRRCEWAISCPA